jgi:hypothetical protein
LGRGVTSDGCLPQRALPVLARRGQRHEGIGAERLAPEPARLVAVE